MYNLNKVVETYHGFEIIVLDIYCCLLWDNMDEKSMKDDVNLWPRVFTSTQREVVDLVKKMLETWCDQTLWHHLLWNRSPRRWRWPQAGRLCGKFCVYERAAHLLPAGLHTCQSLREPGLPSGSLSGRLHCPCLLLFLPWAWLPIFTSVALLFLPSLPQSLLQSCTTGKDFSISDLLLSNLFSHYHGQGEN